ncbi:MAG: 30S ribosomal protein S4 [Bryobacterales bacterium]|nr:30S ribosomal protein S4 [Bryobacteraceae bacterium]MDW8131281.1 30S ribosomal protein S4 [Bryobacterales bacterium]
MARYIGPVCRLCRREGVKLFLKGERCHSEKCAIERRNFPPGQHGRERKPKLVGYGLQLREKQKLKRIYGLQERQFRNLFEKAARMKGPTGENLLSLLERRLDNVVYRMGLGTSHAQCRQLVRHGHITVNGRRVNIPSYLTRVNDVIEVHEKSRNNPAILAARDATAHAPAPNWLEVDREAMRGRVIALPTREDLMQVQVNERLIVELYSK